LTRVLTIARFAGKVGIRKPLDGRPMAAGYS
jgi:hypothetical protein